jgi:hypothetical protein
LRTTGYPTSAAPWTQHHAPTMNAEFSAIEVPGEANPLTEGILYHVLRSASSSDPTQIQTGTKQLQAWEKTGGFYPLLQVRCVHDYPDHSLTCA